MNCRRVLSGFLRGGCVDRFQIRSFQRVLCALFFLDFIQQIRRLLVLCGRTTCVARLLQ